VVAGWHNRSVGASGTTPDAGVTGAEIAEMITAAGYGPHEPVAVGVDGPAESPVAMGRGRTRSGAPFGVDTLTYAASLSKQITAAGAALLVRENVLDVEASLSRLLPRLPAWAGRVRIRHLVHHTAGLPTEDQLTAVAPALARHRDNEAVIEALALVPDLARPPGTAYEYNNAGYACLASVVERAAGQAFGEFAADRIFGPLGMSGSCYWSGPQPEPPGAESFAPPDQPVPLTLGDGGVWTTLRDLMRWNRAVLDDALGVSDLTTTRGSLDDGTPLHYAWGFGIPSRGGQPVHAAGGNVPGMTATLRRLPVTGRALVVLTQTDGTDRILRLTAELLDRLCSSKQRPS
jgi:CubicO group peptidase (beta-lactamase class C family)